MSVDWRQISLSSSILRRDIKSRIWRNDPVRFVEERLGEFLWSKQKEILRSIVHNRRTAVQSAHGIGKSFLAARAAAWWISVHPPGQARVITSAPTANQVRAVLWQELARAHAAGNLAGRLNQTEWWLPIPGSKREEIVGIGRKPADHNSAGFQGFHERYVLVIFDEACGMDKPMWDGVDGLLSNDDCRLLSIGNPDDPLSEFANECSPGSGANVIRVSAFDTPNLTGEYVPDHIKHRLTGRKWIDEKLVRWGEDNPLYIAKVLGEFPEATTDGLIPMRWIRAAQDRDLVSELKTTDPNELGVDIGGGGNKSTIAHRIGGRVRIIHRDQEPDTMKTLGRVIMALNSTKATIAKVDKDGIGWGVVDRGKELRKPIVGVQANAKAYDTERFMNLKAEGLWNLRERFEDGTIDIDENDDDLAAQLVKYKWKPGSGGRIQIVDKKEMGLGNVNDVDKSSSPDDAEAVWICFLNIKKKKAGSIVWGREKTGDVTV